MKDITLLELLKNGVHFGHQTSKWHPRMRPFIFTSRNGIHILDLEQSLAHLNRARDFAQEVAARGGTVLFIGTKRQCKTIIAEEASRAESPYINERWLGGLFTNHSTVGKVISRLKTLVSDRETGKLEKYTKKERFGFDDEIEKLEKLVGGVRKMEKLPDAVFIVDIKAEKTALREAKKMGIPIIAMVDSNVDPDGIAYPIPANDDGTKSIALVAAAIADAVIAGRKAMPAPVAKTPAGQPAAAETEAVPEQTEEVPTA